MRFLAFDTSSKVATLVAMNESKVVAQKVLGTELARSERVLWAIDTILKKAKWKLSDLDFLGVGVGPGSFTGLRIGITTGRTLADVLGKPLVGVSSLAVLARPIAEKYKKKNPLIVLTRDACKGELFAIMGTAEEMLNDRFEQVSLRPEQLAERISEKLNEQNDLKWILTGQGRTLYPEAWKTLPSKREIKIPNPKKIFLRPVDLGLAVQQRYSKGHAKHALHVRPDYLRAPDAELKLKARLASATN
jgi:tRNA threonylcarbamoyladenosine biosynthesis protein TsaB